MANVCDVSNWEPTVRNCTINIGQVPHHLNYSEQLLLYQLYQHTINLPVLLNCFHEAYFGNRNMRYFPLNRTSMLHKY